MYLRPLPASILCCLQLLVAQSSSYPPYDELGGVLPSGCVSDENGFLYLAEDALPLAIRLESKRLIKILTSPRSTNESQGGRELETQPLTAVEIQAPVTAVLLGGFTDDLVKEASRLALTGAMFSRYYVRVRSTRDVGRTCCSIDCG